MINEQLKKLYLSKLDGLKSLVSELSNQKINDYASPLLMYCWEDNYLSSKYKILFIGQETNGWGYKKPDNMENLESSIFLYKDIEFGTKAEKSNPNRSPFWRSINYINNELNGECRLNFLWTNVLKFGNWKGKGRPHPNVTKLENEYFNVLEEEIKIVKPNVVIFFSGPYYDNNIRNQLEGVKFEKCCDYPIREREIARLTHPSLPFHSYRTYHPGYYPGHKKRLEKIIELIKENKQKH